VRTRSAELLAAAPPGSVVVNDVPLIVEKGMSGLYTLVIVVFAALETRLDRLVRVRGMSRDEALARIGAQASDEQRRAVADIAIENDGTPQDLDRAVAAAWEQIKS
jgi:dephospho-CoA kinase